MSQIRLKSDYGIVANGDQSPSISGASRSTGALSWVLARTEIAQINDSRGEPSITEAKQYRHARSAGMTTTGACRYGASTRLRSEVSDGDTDGASKSYDWKAARTLGASPHPVHNRDSRPCAKGKQYGNRGVSSTIDVG